MIQDISPQISHILNLSIIEAKRYNRSKVDATFLLLGILQDKRCEAYKVIERVGVSPDAVRNQLQQFVTTTSEEDIAHNNEPQLDLDVERILRLSQLEARLQKDEEATDLHLLLALLHDHINRASKIMSVMKIDYRTVVQLLNLKTMPQTSQGELSLGDSREEREEEASREDTLKNKSVSEETPIIDTYGIDLTHLATKGLLDPIVGREAEIERMAQILSRRKKNNPILIGEPGVGKSALVEGLAQLIVQNKVPHLLSGKRVVSLDMATMVAGTQYRGQFEERLRRLIEEMKNNDRLILFIDEIHTIVGAGGAPGSLDAANILKPALARGEIQCIGATTIREFKKTIEKDGALDRRFQKIQLEATTPEDTMRILENIKKRYEEHHKVCYTEKAIEACVQLTERYISDRALPDKAIDALDEAGSRVHLLNVHIPPHIQEKEEETQRLKKEKNTAAIRQEYELAANLRDQQLKSEQELERLKEEWQQELRSQRVIVDIDDVASVVSLMSGVPVERMNEEENIRLKGMKKTLSEKVIAQNKAITRLTRAITRNRIGLKDPNRPIGTFMFVGPTGVGKTHLVKSLADFMFGKKEALIRIDMSEYGEKFSTSRLVGSPPGYVGYEEGGQLTEQVRRHPYSIILLDEIEKAHPDVFNTLLQVMDEGRMTDGNGTTVDFRNTIIIMTSNSGSRQIKEFGAGIGFSTTKGLTTEAAEAIVRKSLQRQFAPEFLNRIDDIIMFEPLNKDSIQQIANIELNKLKQRLQEKNRNITISKEVVSFIVQKGYDAQYGARLLRRVIQEVLEDPICDLYLEDERENFHATFDPIHKKVNVICSDVS